MHIPGTVQDAPPKKPGMAPWELGFIAGIGALLAMAVISVVVLAVAIPSFSSSTPTAASPERPAPAAPVPRPSTSTAPAAPPRAAGPQSYGGVGEQAVVLRESLSSSKRYRVDYTYTGDAFILKGSPERVGSMWAITMVDLSEYGDGSLKSGSTIVGSGRYDAFTVSNSPGTWTVTFTEL